MIYLDGYFWGLCNQPHKIYRHLTKVPDHCDTLGMTIYHARTTDIDRKIKIARDRCDRLIVVLNEPPDDVLKIMRRHAHPATWFFSDFVTDHDVFQYQVAINWFMSSTNIYVTDAWARDLLSKLLFDQHKPYIFDCLLGSTRPYRDEVSRLYDHSRYRHQIYFTYFRNNIEQGHWNLDIMDRRSVSDTVPVADTVTNICNVLPVEIYNQSHYSIVTESTCDDHLTRFTEKTAKPLLAQRPFVVFSGRHFLRNLRSLGFQTFDPIIDESYDDTANQAQRFRQAWQQVERLCTLDPVSVRQSLLTKLEHNQRHFLKTDWHGAVRDLLNMERRAGIEPAS